MRVLEPAFFTIAQESTLEGKARRYLRYPPVLELKMPMA